MPTVLITGLSGFLASHVALSFLTRGWHVRGTVRSPSKLASVASSAALAPYIKEARLELVLVGPLESLSTNWQDAVRGVDAVVHTASPVAFGDDDFREQHLAPAVNGTKGVLEAAAKEGSVKNVVMTSSYGAVGQHRTHPNSQGGMKLDEGDWNPYTMEELDEMVRMKSEGNGTFLSGALYYMGAKKYAEKAAWAIQEESGTSWTLATINCVMILGPPIQPLDSLSHGGMSTEFMWALMAGKDKPIMPTLFPYFVDVRDAAEAHYQAIVRQSQGRFILSAGAYDFQEFADMLRTLFPEEADRVCEGQPGKYMFQDPGVYDLRNEKSIRELGITYRSKEETVQDAFTRFLELERAGLK